MIDDRQRQTSVSGPRPVEARGRGPTGVGHAGSRVLCDDLETLRDCVLQRLDSIEVLARRRLSAPSTEISRLEQSLKQKIEELEHEKSKLRGGVEEQESTCRRLMTELKTDRQMLTEAWERLERERIDATAVGGDHGSPAHRSRQSDRVMVPVTPTSTPPAPAATNVDSSNPVTQTILRQFQTLCSDVRRTADSRCSTR